MKSFLSEHKKTHSCGQLRASDVGQRVVLTGWVDVRRDHGGCVFIDLRDRDGITQVVFDPHYNERAHALAGDLRNEFCVGVTGEVLSRGGNAYVRLALGLRLGDATAGFRAYRADSLRSLDLGAVESHGYCFQVDMAWRVARAGGRVVEVPITFVERTAGRSKMSRSIVTEALWKVTVWGARRRTQQLRELVRRER